jgi:hypothetical protein
MLYTKGFLTLIIGCMDLMWLYAWAAFSTAPLIPGVFPFHACAATFCMAFALTRLVGYRGWLVITVGILHLVTLLVGVGLVLHGIFALQYPFWRVGEWFGVLGVWDAAHRGFRIGTVCFWTMGIYVEGVRLARRQINYQSVTARFDLGLGAFFILFVLQLLIQVKYGTPAHHTFIGYCMLAFFAFGVFAVGLARNRTGADHAKRGSRCGAGLLLGFSVLVALAGTGSALIILQYLSTAARVVHDGMGSLSSRIGPSLTKIITFIFRPLASGNSTGSWGSGSVQILSPSATGGRISIFGLILLWTVLGLVGTVTLFLLGKFFWYAIRRLFSRTGKNKSGRSGFSLPLGRFLSFLQALFRLIFKHRGALGVIELYTQLLSWGKKSGIPRAFHETPIEYENRLSRVFPEAGPEFERITNAYNLIVYGGAPEDQAGFQEAPGAWRKLLRLWIWLARLKTLHRNRDFS